MQVVISIHSGVVDTMHNLQRKEGNCSTKPLCGARAPHPPSVTEVA